MSSKFLDLSGNELMGEISKGEGMPGAGAVAALSSIAAAELLLSICKLTLAKKFYQDVHKDIEEVVYKVESNRLPMLRKIIDKDAELVAAMLQWRRKRDKENDATKKEEHAKKAYEALELATDSMMDLCDTALDIVPMALFVYKVGLRSAKADAGVVINTLLSAVSSGLFMVLVNLKAANGCKWVESKHAETEIYFGRLQEYQSIFNGRLANLYNNTWK